MSSTELDTCANCGHTIGKLETPHLWNQQKVCGVCIKRLASLEPMAPSASSMQSLEQLTQQRSQSSTQSLEQLSLQLASNRTDPHSSRVLMPGERVCPNPNCGFCGKGKREARGSGVIFIFLILVGLIPGLIYWAVCGGYRIVCPKCGMEWSVEFR